jgi:Asp-tRNA(Asn)/Glu-tRNA(Gln) amidotransferase A subunit family amidase
MEELYKMSALELGRLISSKQVKSIEVTEALLKRIEKLNPRLNAYCTTSYHSALEEARSADKSIAKGEIRGLLWGVPVSVKDLLETKGIRTTFGSPYFANHIPDQDAVVVERLRAAGCPILGKTNTSEFGCTFTAENPVFGPTLNPWNLRKSPGGSSGGAAAQVAAGMGPLGIGSDGGGSVRVPASCCGVFGLKPQFGRIPSWPRHDSWSVLSHLGPITRTVRDAAAFLNATAGPDDRDRTSLPPSSLDYLESCDGNIQGLKVAWSPNLGYGKIDPEVREICEKAVRTFEDMGCVVEEAHPGIPSPEKLFLQSIAPRVVTWLEGELPDILKESANPVFQFFRSSTHDLSARDVIRNLFEIEKLWDRICSFFQKYELLLTPTIAAPPFDSGFTGPRYVSGEKVSPLLPFFTFPFNLTGQPAASVPAGFTGDGLPVGLQIIGRRFSEPTVLRASACFEEARPWRDLWPQLD